MLFGSRKYEWLLFEWGSVGSKKNLQYQRWGRPQAGAKSLESVHPRMRMINLYIYYISEISGRVYFAEYCGIWTGLMYVCALCERLCGICYTRQTKVYTS